MSHGDTRCHALPDYSIDLPFVKARLATSVEEVGYTSMDEVRTSLIRRQPTDFKYKVRVRLPRVILRRLDALSDAGQVMAGDRSFIRLDVAIGGHSLSKQVIRV